ncbi:50S ribosomal protein L15 [Buchnera aphidicola (Takecallis taiwana)]|uniref:50S ribosomal protein L15 n=1 Tax=Buchnera aphidicola TaxID=9 RepID=UPI0031B6B05F
MYLNTLKFAHGSKKKHKRVGRGIGTGFGKTCGRGHKGQTSRTGSSIRRGFEGGQMPLYRRIPKFGFLSRKQRVTQEVRLSEINKISDQYINLNTLKNFNIIKKNVKYVKIINKGVLDKKIVVQDIKVTKGALVAIEMLGGTVKETVV